MAKISKTVVDADLRNRIFMDMFTSSEKAELSEGTYQKINDRQFGVLLTDKNGVERYCRVGVIVAEEREDMTARELMQKEIDEYNAKQEAKAAKAAERAKKAEADKARREVMAKEKEA